MNPKFSKSCEIGESHVQVVNAFFIVYFTNRCLAYRLSRQLIIFQNNRLAGLGIEPRMNVSIMPLADIDLSYFKELAAARNDRASRDFQSRANPSQLNSHI